MSRLYVYYARDEVSVDLDNRQMERQQLLLESSDPAETPEIPVELPPPFEYEPLDTSADCIRLLAIDPLEEGDETVKCSLTNVRFSEKLDYEALSYTWGLPTPTRKIWVNGKPIDIRKNLHDALICLRRSRKSRLLWADAICIDQSNIEERKFQVGFMDYIYTRAAKVLIWLGRAEPTVEKAFAEMGEDVKEVDNDLKACLEWMCNQSYWKRLWVIQEIALSRNLRVYVGPHPQSWDRFLLHLTKYKNRDREVYGPTSARRGLQILETDISPPRRRYYDRTSVTDPAQETVISKKTADQIDLIRDLGAKRLDRHGSANRLEQLLEDFQYAECEEPRDKIYGLLGLAHDCRSIPADYSRPLFDLYSDILAHFCQTQKLAESGSNAFDRSMRITRFSQLIQSRMGSSNCPKMANIPKNIVVATGAIGGAIHRLGPTYEEVCSSSSIYRQWRLAAESHYFTSSDREKLRESNEAFDIFLFKSLDVVKRDVFGIDPQDLYSRASPDGGFWDDKEANWSKKRPKAGFCSPEQLALLNSRKNSTKEQLLNFFMAIASLDEKGDVDSQFGHDNQDNWCEEKGDFHPFEQPVLSHPPMACSNPRLFLGSNLLLGLAPPEAKEGDVICHFWKTDVVALLRKEIESGVYRIVGRIHLSTGYLRNLEPVYRDWVKPVKLADTIRIEMDVRTLYKLTASS